jgi:mycofactocin system creatininase family protein
MTANLASATWLETEGDERLLVVPVGSLEQHGPHLPLDTDTRIAVLIAESLAQRRGDVVVAPAVPYGASGEHEGFPGTVSVGRDALAAYLLELVRSALATYRRILFLNGHGGNATTLEQVAQRSRYEGRDVRCWTPRIPDGDLHAGVTETSLLLAMHPWAVRTSLIAAGATEPPHALWPRLRESGVRAVSANGVLGDPTRATAAAGRALHAGLVDDLEAFVSEWST